MRTLSYIVSFLFHPLLMLTYITIVLHWVNPYLFGVPNLNSNLLFLYLIFVSTFFIPMLAIFVMQRLGLISSLNMPEPSDRILPFITVAIFYTFMTYYTYKSPVIPNPFFIAISGATLALFTALIINQFTKISLHALGMGGLVAFSLLILHHYSYPYIHIPINASSTLTLSNTMLPIIALILAGIVGTARLILGSHTPQQIYLGYIIGIWAQFTCFIVFS